MKKRDMITIGLQRYAEAMENLLKTIIDDDECEHEWEEWRYLYECKKCGAIKNREQGCEHSHIKSMCPKCCDKDQPERPEWVKKFGREFSELMGRPYEPVSEAVLRIQHNTRVRWLKDLIRTEVITKLCEEIKEKSVFKAFLDDTSALVVPVSRLETVKKRWLA